MTDSSLSSKIRASFPFPIAFRFALMEEEVSAHRKFLLMLDVFEVAIRYLATVLVAEYAHQPTQTEVVDRLLLERLLKKMSLGDWTHLFRETLRYYWTQKRIPFLQELQGFYLQRDKQFKLSPGALAIDEFVSIRNTYKGHGVVEDEETYADLYRKFRQKLDQWLGDLSFLAQYHLLVPFSREKQGGYYLCHGDSNKFSELTAISLPAGSQTSIEELVWLLDTKTNTPLLLWPFSIFSIARIDEIYFYDGCQANRRGEIREIKYLGFQKNVPPLICRAGCEGSRVISWLSQYFRPKCDKIKITLGEETMEKVCYYFDAIRADIEFHIKNFVGRSSVLHRLDSFLNEQLCGYFIIYGIPGQGKSAFSAHLVNERKYVHHFVKQGGIRANVSRFFQSLLEQLHDKYEIKENIPSSQQEILEYFVTLLQKISQERLLPKGSKEVIVIDALDELSQEDRETLQFLPRYLPESVYIVMTSRPLHSLRYCPFQVSRLDYDLESLSVEEVAMLLQQAKLEATPEAAHQIHQISQGNPLYLRLLIEESRWELDMARLPVGIESLFEQIMSRIQKNPNANDLFAILCTLSIARKGLTINELADILNMKRRQVKTLLETLESFLIDRHGEYGIFHLKFQEYLLEKVLEKEEIAAAHRALITYSQPWQEKKLAYGYDYLTWHYFTLKDYPAIFRLLEEDFLREKVKYCQSREACLPDLMLAFEAALAANIPHRILYYGLLYTLTCKTLSKGVESGEFVINAIAGDMEVAVREVRSISHQKTRILALVALAEIYLYTGQTEMARNLLTQTSTEDPLQLDEHEIYWLSQFAGKLVAPLDQGLAMRLLKLVKTTVPHFGLVADTSPQIANYQQPKNLKGMIDGLIVCAQHSPQPVQTLSVAFAASEVFRNFSPRPVALEGEIQSDIIRVMLVHDVEKAGNLAREIVHLPSRAFAYTSIADHFASQGITEKAAQWEGEAEKLADSQPACEKAWIYFQILRARGETSPNAPRWQQLCLELYPQISQVEDRDLFLLSLLPYLVNNMLVCARELLGQISNKAIYVRTLAKMGRQLSYSGKEDLGEEHLLEALQKVAHVGVAEYRAYVVEEVAAVLSRTYNERLLTSALQLTRDMAMPYAQIRSFLYLGDALEANASAKASAIWEEALATGLKLTRKWEREEAFALFMRALMEAQNTTWAKFMPAIFPEITSPYNRAIALIHSHFEKQCPAKQLVKEGGDQWSLSHVANLTLCSWLAAEFQKTGHVEISKFYLQKSDEILDQSIQKKQDSEEALEKIIWNLAPFFPKTAIEYLPKFESEISRGLTMFRTLDRMGQVNVADAHRLLDIWYSPSDVPEIPEVYGSLSQFIYKKFTGQERENLDRKLLAPLEDTQKWPQVMGWPKVLGMVHMAKNLMLYDRDNALSMLQRVEEFLDQEPLAGQDWRKSSYSRDGILAALLDTYVRYDLDKATSLRKKLQSSLYSYHLMMAWHSARENKVAFLRDAVESISDSDSPLNRSGILSLTARQYYLLDKEYGKKLRNRATLEAQRETDPMQQANILFRVAMSWKVMEREWAEKQFDETVATLLKLRLHDSTATDQLIVSLVKMFSDPQPVWGVQFASECPDMGTKLVNLILNPKIKGAAAEKVFSYFSEKDLEKYRQDLLLASLENESSFAWLCTRLLPYFRVADWTSEVQDIRQILEKISARPF